MTPREIKYIVIHCSATKASQNIDIRDIDRWHRGKGWEGVGYHYVITRDGRVQGGRSLNEPGAHTKGHNYQSWGVCLVGGLDLDGKPENNFTQEQFAALRQLLVSLHAMAPNAHILGHRDLSPDINGDGMIQRNEWLKDCPCFDVGEWLAMNQRSNDHDLT